MGKIKFELNPEGVKALLNDQDLMDGMQKIGERVASTAGDEFAADTRPGSKRAHTFVKATTAHAYYSNLKHNTLLKALQS